MLCIKINSWEREREHVLAKCFGIVESGRCAFFGQVPQLLSCFIDLFLLLGYRELFRQTCCKMSPFCVYPSLLKELLFLDVPKWDVFVCFHQGSLLDLDLGSFWCGICNYCQINTCPRKKELWLIYFQRESARVLFSSSSFAFNAFNHCLLFWSRRAAIQERPVLSNHIDFQTAIFKVVHWKPPWLCYIFILLEFLNYKTWEECSWCS